MATFLVGDTVAFSDALRLNEATQVSETLTLSDQSDFSTIFPSERVVFTDSVAVSYIRPGLLVQDQIAFNDFLTTSLTRSLSVSDTFSFLDAVSSPLSFVVPSDSLSLSDSAVATFSDLPGMSLTQYITDSFPAFRDNLSLSAPSAFLLYTNSIRLTDFIEVSLQSSTGSYLRRYLNDVV